MDGDFIAHGHAGDFNMTFDEKSETWTDLKNIISSDMQTLRTTFPDKILLPTIGNNDVIVHNTVPCNQEVADMYYQQLYDLWFPEEHRPPNFDNKTVSDTFKNGGYYRYDFANTDLTLLALNTMYYS